MCRLLPCQHLANRALSPTPSPPGRQPSDRRKYLITCCQAGSGRAAGFSRVWTFRTGCGSDSPSDTSHLRRWRSGHCGQIGPAVFGTDHVTVTGEMTSLPCPSPPSRLRGLGFRAATRRRGDCRVVRPQWTHDRADCLSSQPVHDFRDGRRCRPFGVVRTGQSGRSAASGAGVTYCRTTSRCRRISICWCAGRSWPSRGGPCSHM